MPPRHASKRVAAVCAGALAIAIAGAPIAPGARAGEVAEAATARAEAGTWQASRLAYGEVMARQRAILSAPAKGAVVAVYADVGDRVSAGQRLAQLDPATVATMLQELITLKDRVELARRLVDQLTGLEGQQLAPLRDLLLAQSNLADAREKLGEDWLALLRSLPADSGRALDRQSFVEALAPEKVPDLARELSKLRAPFDAVVAKRFVMPAMPVAAGDPLFEIEDRSTLYVDVRIPLDTFAAWQTGEAVAVALAGAGAAEIRLRLAAANAIVERETGMAMLRFGFEPGAAALLPGQWIEVSLRAPPEPVVWVPEAAVVARAGKTYCLRLENDDFVPVAVRVGPLVEGRIPVLSGLAAGDEILVVGAYERLYRDLGQMLKFED